MCDSVITADGRKLGSVAALREHGVDIPPDVPDGCLCRVELGDVLGPTWVRRDSWCWEETNEDGLTYEQARPKSRRERKRGTKSRGRR